MQDNQMTLQQFCDGIQLAEDVQEKIMQAHIDEKTYATFWKWFREEPEQFYAKIREQNEERFFALVLYCNMAVDVYPEYLSKGMNETIYFDTFADIRIWSEACKRKYGVIGLMEYEWVALSLACKVIRLGRLQFAPGNVEKEFTITSHGETVIVPVGTKQLDVHIPEGSSLDPQSCEESFAMARQFFGKDYSVYTCTSWILAPILREWLSPETNLIQFQNRFQLIDVEYPLRQAEERVFGEIREDRENYPEDNHLQRMLKRYVMEGNDPGLGKGVFIVK